MVENVNGNQNLSEWQKSKNEFERLCKNLPLEDKVTIILSRFKKVSISNLDDFRDAVNYVFNFFDQNSDKKDSFLIDGLDTFLDLLINPANGKPTNKKLTNKIFADKKLLQILLNHLKINKLSVLFQHSPQFWHLLYKIIKKKEDLEGERPNKRETKKGKKAKTSKDVSEDVKALLFKFNLNSTKHEKERRPLATDALMILQEMRDFLEKYGICLKNEKILLFYLTELVDNSKNFYKSKNYNPSNPYLIVENTKKEITRLLKCLYGFEFDTSTCDHSPSSKDKVVNSELLDKIFQFYLPKDWKTVLQMNEFDSSLVEMCQILRPSIEALIKKGMKEDFNEYFLSVQEYLPKCAVNQNGAMRKLVSPHKRFDSSTCVRHISINKQRISQLVSHDLPVSMAQACYVLTHANFHKNPTSSKTLNLAKMTLMLGQHTLSDKLITQTWNFIGKHFIGKHLNGKHSNGKPSNPNLLFAFYMSLLFNQQNPGIHTSLASACLLQKRQRLSSSDNNDMYWERFKAHILFAKFYFKNETNVERVILNLNDILAAIDRNGPNNKNMFVSESVEFFEVGVKHLTDLVGRNSNNSIQLDSTNVAQFSDLNRSLKSLYPTHFNDFDVFVTELVKKRVNNERQNSNGADVLKALALTLRSNMNRMLNAYHPINNEQVHVSDDEEDEEEDKNPRKRKKPTNSNRLALCAKSNVEIKTEPLFYSDEEQEEENREKNSNDTGYEENGTESSEENEERQDIPHTTFRTPDNEPLTSKNSNANEELEKLEAESQKLKEQTIENERKKWELKLKIAEGGNKKPDTELKEENEKLKEKVKELEDEKTRWTQEKEALQNELKSYQDEEKERQKVIERRRLRRLEQEAEDREEEERLKKRKRQ